MSAFQKGMEPARHVPTPTVHTLALCGVGANWPTSTPFEREGHPATCKECIEIKGRSE